MDLGKASRQCNYASSLLLKFLLFVLFADGLMRQCEMRQLFGLVHLRHEIHFTDPFLDFAHQNRITHVAWFLMILTYIWLITGWNWSCCTSWWSCCWWWRCRSRCWMISWCSILMFPETEFFFRQITLLLRYCRRCKFQHSTISWWRNSTKVSSCFDKKKNISQFSSCVD